MKSENDIYYANVGDQVSPPAFGIRACFAGEMPKVPKAWGLTASLCSRVFGDWCFEYKTIRAYRDVGPL